MHQRNQSACRRTPLLGLCLLVCVADAMAEPPNSAPSDSDIAPTQTSIQLAQPVVQTWQIGVVVQAGNGPITGIVATMPVPQEWPEQAIKIVKRQKSGNVRSISYRSPGTGARQMVVSISRLTAGEQASALVTLEIAKRNIGGPAQTETLRIPARPPRTMRDYLRPSPYIESDDREIRAFAREVVTGKSTAWEQAEAIYEWVRAKVEYRFDRRIKGARQALKDGYGDCEELTSLFVAMCRAVDIPARAVWIPGHCYPEFYLEDDRGEGHWFPCQAAGSRQFGGMIEGRPILQKGDNFRLPGSRKPQRYVQETLTAKHAVADPSVQFIQRQIQVSDSADGDDGEKR